MWELAIVEAKKLKMAATKEEISKLNIGTCDADSFRRCIYGQMTGTCESERAKELISLCCEKIYDARNSFIIAASKLNGRPFDETKFTKSKVRAWNYVSPIECLVLGRNAGREAVNVLIPFLKGETKKIVIPK